MFEILISILTICLFFAAIRIAFRITWGVTKIIATVLMVLAIPVFIVCLLFAGGFVLLLPVALIGGAIGLLKACT